MDNHNATFWYFSIICVFFIINIPSDTNADKEIPLTKISNGLSAPTLKFFYWLVDSQYLISRNNIELVFN